MGRGANPLQQHRSTSNAGSRSFVFGAVGEQSNGGAAGAGGAAADPHSKDAPAAAPGKPQQPTSFAGMQLARGGSGGGGGGPLARQPSAGVAGPGRRDGSTTLFNLLDHSSSKSRHASG